MIINAPRIFCVLEIASGELVFSSTAYSSATSFIRSIPDRIRSCFAVVRYDANEHWQPSSLDI